jgi:ribosomal protein L12E/L44/L45/RPP1/RPP2
MLMRQRFSVADLAVLVGGWLDSDVDQVLADADAAAAGAAAGATGTGGAAGAGAAGAAAGEQP